MADGYLQKMRAEETHMPFVIRESAAPRFAPTFGVRSDGSKAYIPKHQHAGIESLTVWQSYTPQLEYGAAGANTGFNQASYQHAAVQLCEFQLRQADIHCTDLFIEWEFTWPADGANRHFQYVPGPVWIDRVEFSADGQQPFQTIYGELILRMMVASLSNERLYQYALASGGWINPPNMPGVWDSEPAITLTEGTPNTVEAGDYVPAYPTAQLLTAGYSVYPFAPSQVSTTVGAYADTRGDFQKIRVPLIGSFVQQIGVFQFNWLETGTLYVRVFSAGRPQYSSLEADTTSDISVTAVRLIVRAISFPGNHRAEAMIDKANKGKFGLSCMFIDFLRNVTNAASTVTAGSTYDVDLNFTIGRHVSWLILIANGRTGSANDDTVTAWPVSAAWLLSPQAGTANYLVNSTQCNEGQSTAFGDQAAGRPACDIIDANGNVIFSNGGSMTLEQLKFMQAASKLPGNLYGNGLVKGQDCFAPFYYMDIPWFFGNPVNSLMGIYDGSIQFPINTRLRITFGANALGNTVVAQYTIYAATWRALEITDGKSQNRIFVPNDPIVRRN